MAWPDTADGDVFRRLEAQGFDFDKKYWVDFNIDFERWPPADEVVHRLGSAFPDAVVETKEDEEIGGYLLIRFFRALTYDFVIDRQAELSEIVAPFGGVCDSWGVLH
jgi:hypothetical protein